MNHRIAAVVPVSGALRSAVQCAAAAIALYYSAVAQTQAAGLPACDEAEVIETFLDAFFYAQREAGSDAEIVSLDEIEEIGFSKRPADDAWSQVRGCAAQARLSTGKQFAAWYKIVLPRAPDPIGCRVRMCTAEFDPVHEDCEEFKTIPE